MSRAAIPLDSLVVVPDTRGDVMSAVWSEEFARVIGEHLGYSGDLRVVPHALVRARAKSSDDSPEEIARHFNARAALHCAVVVTGDDLDVRVELIDTFGESVICDSSYFVSLDEAVCVQEQIIRWIGSCCFTAVAAPRIDAIDRQSYVAKCARRRFIVRGGLLRRWRFFARPRRWESARSQRSSSMLRREISIMNRWPWRAKRPRVPTIWSPLA